MIGFLAPLGDLFVVTVHQILNPTSNVVTYRLFNSYPPPRGRDRVLRGIIRWITKPNEKITRPTAPTPSPQLKTHGPLNRLSPPCSGTFGSYPFFLLHKLSMICVSQGFGSIILHQYYLVDSLSETNTEYFIPVFKNAPV